MRLPRTRGDGPFWPIVYPHVRQAPPHTRGWTLSDWNSCSWAYGSPAHAGMDPRRGLFRCQGPRLPRTRGDGPARRFKVKK